MEDMCAIHYSPYKLEETGHVFKQILHVLVLIFPNKQKASAVKHMYFLNLDHMWQWILYFMTVGPCCCSKVTKRKLKFDSFSA